MDIEEEGRQRTEIRRQRTPQLNTPVYHLPELQGRQRVPGSTPEEWTSYSTGQAGQGGRKAVFGSLEENRRRKNERKFGSWQEIYDNFGHLGLAWRYPSEIRFTVTNVSQLNRKKKV